MRKRTAESGGRPVWTTTRRKWGTGLGLEEGRVIQDATETARADMAGVMLRAPSATSVMSWWQQAVRQVPCCAGAPRPCSQRNICMLCADVPVIDRAHGTGAASTGANIQGSSRSKTIKAIRRTNRRKLRTIPQFRDANFYITTQRSSNVNPATDNLKTVVDAVFSGKERQFNRRFLALANHYLFEPVACTPASGWEKGQVENQVGNIREWLFAPMPHFADFAELNGLSVAAGNWPNECIRTSSAALPRLGRRSNRHCGRSRCRSTVMSNNRSGCPVPVLSRSTVTGTACQPPGRVK